LFLEAITDTKTEDSFELNARTLSYCSVCVEDRCFSFRVEFIEEYAVVVFELSAERNVEDF
jgi:hypothetical protein